MDKFNSAISFLPPKIHEVLSDIPLEIKLKTYEIRLRLGKPIMLITSDGALFVDKLSRITYIYNGDLYVLNSSEIIDSFNRMCNFSVYSHADSISQGFITLSSGHRVGICGTAVTDRGNITSIRNINSLNIRIAREFKGCSDEILTKVFKNKLKNVIISGPPSSGKTTLLRDIARQISSARFGEYHKVTIVDERCEISPVNDGICMCDTGPNTDILSSFKKSDGIMSALRTLSPNIIICDEIGTSEECNAIISGINSGVNFVLTIHASSRNELENKVQFKTLIDNGFNADVVLLSSTPGRIKEFFKTGEYNAKNKFGSSCINCLDSDRAVC